MHTGDPKAAMLFVQLALHCSSQTLEGPCVVQLYAQRLDVELGSTDMAHSGVGLAMSLVTEAVGDLASLQFSFSLLAAAALFTARKVQVR